MRLKKYEAEQNANGTATPAPEQPNQ
jgi:hypothetical protein